METQKSLKSLKSCCVISLPDKMVKKVTWSNNLTDVKVITPQPSVFQHFASHVFLEEEEEEYKEEEEEEDSCMKHI